MSSLASDPYPVPLPSPDPCAASQGEASPRVPMQEHSGHPLGAPHACTAWPAREGLSRGARVRVALAVAPLLIAFAVLAARMAQIQIWQGGRWSAAAERQRYASERLEARRGEILGANGEVLATSIPRQRVIADLPLLKDREQTARALAPLLERSAPELLARMDRDDCRVIYLARGVEPALAQRVKDLRLPGIGLEEGFNRCYLWGPLGCHLIGWSGTDGGMEGLELKLDGLLRGIPGYRTFERDAARRPLSRGDDETWQPTARAPRQGLSVRLTLDPGLQHLAAEELERIVAAYKPQGATALVLDVRTGAILAMACLPDFDPNHPAGAEAAARRNRTLTDCYEPGSTFKTFIAAAALDRGLFSRTDRLDCENGAWNLGYRTLHDAHAYGILTFDECIVHSSNIAAAKMGLRSGPDSVHATVRAFGFGALTGLDLPGEARGIVRPRAVWSRDSLLSIPMGQEISVTPLQLACAYAAMVSGGVLLRPQVVASIASPGGETLFRLHPEPVRRVISPRTSAAMRQILERVVLEGTGRKAWCREYAVGGKTGTAQKVVAGRYSHDKYVGSFCGFAPAANPRLVCLVTVDEPSKGLGYYGGTVAAPAVREILRRGLAHLGVPVRSAEEQARAASDFERRRAGGGD